MSFFELINKRESCRDYSNKKVDKELLVKCIDAARLTPSACNSQPWSFVVVNSEEKSPLVAQCTQSAGLNKFTDNVPAFIVICEEEAKLIGGISQKYAGGDVGAATLNICYAATELGLSTCIMGSVDREKLKEILGLPESKNIRLVLAVGYASSDKVRNKVRRPIDEIMTYIG